MKSFRFKIAIIGVGPKGLYGFERILAQIKANPVNEQVEIHLFNKTEFMGSGDVYRSDQPDYLLMNFSNAHINMWAEDTPPSVVNKHVCFSEYLAAAKQTTTESVDNLYAPRATVGKYLEKGFAELCQNLPENVVLHQHVAEVSSIAKTGEHYTVGFKQQGEKHTLEGFQQILITTGHQRHKAAVRPNENRIPFIYPVDETLKGVFKHKTVAVKGIGLTFIDAVLALTEGKGGSFSKTESGHYSYAASGNEPKSIFPYSKSGWPMLPKYHFKSCASEPKLYIESINTLTNNQLSFKYDIFPLLYQDMEFAYYNTLFNDEKEALKYHTDYEKVKSQLAVFHDNHPGYPRFSLENLLEPVFDPVKTTHQNIYEYLIDFNAGNNLHIVHEAQLRAAAVWKRVSPVFNKLYSFSGLDPGSHQEFDRYYFGKLNRIAFGPPPENLKKIIALAEAGFVDFSYAKHPIIKCNDTNITLSNGTSDTSCDVLIDARIPKNSLEKEASGLFFNLCQNQLARPYINRSKKNSYAPGTVEIDRNGNLINQEGTPENITLYGTPTEGIVHDNDTLSRTRNNFAKPWAEAVIKKLILRKNETNSQTSRLVTHTQ